MSKPCIKVICPCVSEGDYLRRTPRDTRSTKLHLEADHRLYETFVAQQLNIPDALMRSCSLEVRDLEQYTPPSNVPNIPQKRARSASEDDEFDPFAQLGDQDEKEDQRIPPGGRQDQFASSGEAAGDTEREIGSDSQEHQDGSNGGEEQSDEEMDVDGNKIQLLTGILRRRQFGYRREERAPSPTFSVTGGQDTDDEADEDLPPSPLPSPQRPLPLGDEPDIPQLTPLPTPSCKLGPKPTHTPSSLPLDRRELASLENYFNIVMTRETVAAFNAHCRTLEKYGDFRDKKLLSQHMCEALLQRESGLGPIPFNDGYGADNPPHLWDLPRWREQIMEMYAPGVSESKREKTGRRYEIMFAPPSARSKMFSGPALFHPPDSSHLLKLNIPSTQFGLWYNNPLLKDTLEHSEKLMSNLRGTLPTIFGNTARNIFEKWQSQDRMYEYRLWASKFSVPTLYECGFPTALLSHWAIHVEFLDLVMSREPPTYATTQKMDQLAEAFNAGQESLYVQFDLNKVEALPLCIHRILHLGSATITLGDLKHHLQEPVERRIGLQKGDHEFASPYVTIINKIEVMSLKRPEVAELMESFRPRPPNASKIPGTKSGRLAKRSSTCSPLREAELGALESWFAQPGRSIPDNLRGAASRWTRYKAAVLQNGTQLSSLRSDLSRRTDVHSASYFLSSSFDQEGLPAFDSLSAGQAITFTFIPGSIHSQPTLVAFIQLFPPSVVIHNVARMSGTSCTYAIVEVCRIDKVIGVMYSDCRERVWWLRVDGSGDGGEIVDEEELDEADE
ncbi:hypothetical protein P7C70_g8348, partial [Phenoliferia sp. Uapishka_3]